MFNNKGRGGLIDTDFTDIVVELVEDLDTNHFMGKSLHNRFLVDSFSENNAEIWFYHPSRLQRL